MENNVLSMKYNSNTLDKLKYNILFIDCVGSV